MPEDMGRGIIAPTNGDHIGTGASEMRTIGRTTAAALDALARTQEAHTDNLEQRTTDQLGRHQSSISYLRQEMLPRKEAEQYGVEGPEGRIPQIVGGSTTQLNPGEPAVVQITKIGDALYRVDAAVPRGLDGDPAAVGDFSEAFAVEVNTPGSTGGSMLRTVFASRNEVSLVQDESLTVRVPSDFPTLQHAINELSTRSITPGVTIDLLIESGHQPETGIKLNGGDYSQFVVTSEDDVVYVADSFTGPFIEGNHTHLPTLGCLVDMRDRGENGYSALDNSQGYVNIRCGIRNAGQRGCHVRGSQVFAPSSEFTGSNNRNVMATGGAFFDGDAGNFSANKPSGASGDRAVYVSRASYASLHGARVLDAKGDAAITVIRSKVNAVRADVSGAENDGIAATQNSQVSFSEGVANNCGQGIRCQSVSTVDAEQATVNNARDYAVYASTGGQVNMWRGEAQDAGSFTFYALTGAHIIARDVKAPSGKQNFRVSAGSTIVATGSEGESNISFNTITPNGIVYR